MLTVKTTCNIVVNNLFKIISINFNPIKNYSTRLQEVGHLEPPMETGNYKAGQIFLHKLLGYRGVILFPWIAQFVDRDVAVKKKKYMDSDESSKEKSTLGESSQMFYNVLMDLRDSPFIRSQLEFVTLLGNEGSGKDLVFINGMDYVAHKNILPYKPTEHLPLQHEWLNKFFVYDPNNDPQLIPKRSLQVWEKRNHSWLEFTKVKQFHI